MKKPKDPIDHLTPALIQAYRQGRLSPEAMHQVEKLMLEHELYGEAVEGIENLEDPASLEHHVSDLRERMASKLSKKKTMTSIVLLRVAAVLLLLLVAGITYTLLTQKPETQELASNEVPEETYRTDTAESFGKAEEREKMTAQVPENENPEPDADDDVQEENPSSNTPKSGRASTASSPTESTVIKSIPDEEAYADLVLEEETEEIIVAQDLEILDAAVADVEIITDSIDTEIPTSAFEIELDAVAKKEKLAARPANPVTIKGKVVDAEDGMPLPGANILRKGASEGTVTDMNGFFEMLLENPAETLVVNYLGYASQEMAVTDTGFLNIAMKPDATALGEVVVTGYSTKGDGIEGVEVIETVPNDGWPAYQRYLKENLEYPKAARQNGIRGRVKLTFEVQADGSLVNFQVRKGLGHGCDEEAIRLIKEGPPWTPKTVNGVSVRSTVSINVRFKPRKN